VLASTVVTGTNVVEIIYGGPVRAEEMLDAREEVEGVVRRHGAARLLVVYGHFDPCRWEPRAMWSDLQTAKLFRDVDRVAVVADADWVDSLHGIDGDARRADVKGFHADRREDAIAWLQR
jgi:SpoIIAA-like